ncbi:MAG: hypothetical protein HYV26_11530 [Candidatus Hydrogenedentes bacterium]|nr:hypothetical protein [Candidatus Hydrogenedentota bacterium]
MPGLLPSRKSPRRSWVRNPEQVTENAKTAGVLLSAEEIEIICREVEAVHWS